MRASSPFDSEYPHWRFVMHNGVIAGLGLFCLLVAGGFAAKGWAVYRKRRYEEVKRLNRAWERASGRAPSGLRNDDHYGDG